MKVERVDEFCLLFSGLSGLELELLQRIPQAADYKGDPKTQSRLFPQPYQYLQDKSAAADWEDYVRPELAEHFREAIEMIQIDLKGARPSEVAPENEDQDEEMPIAQIKLYEFALPLAHLQHWISGLNQARLALYSRYQFTDQELENGLPDAIHSERDIAQIQSHVFGVLLECLLYHSMRQELEAEIWKHNQTEASLNEADIPADQEDEEE